MLRVLIAEDEISELEWLDKYFKKNYPEQIDVVATCTKGKDAIEKCLELSPDVAFLDIQMPQLSGLDVAEAIKKEDERVFIVFISAHSNFEYAKNAVKIGAFDYLVKPFELKELDDVIKRISNKVETKLDSDVKKIMQHLNNSTQKVALSPVVRLSLDYIQKHYAEKISLESLADDIGFSSSYVSRCLVKNLGKNFNTILLETRCNEALKLLTQERLTVSEVSYKVGFSDPNYFGKCFKTLMGQSPKSYSNLLMGKNIKE